MVHFKNLALNDGTIDYYLQQKKFYTIGASFQHRINSFIELGYAVLMVNYRGSIGNGDAIQQSILGNVGMVNCYKNIIPCINCLKE